MRQALLRTLLIAVLLAAPPTLRGQGTIVYHNPPNIPLFVDGALYELDLDQDGTVDFHVNKGGSSGFAASGIGHNASLAVPEQPPDIGALITPIPAGEYIGPSLTPPNAWFETYSFEPIPGFPVTVPATFHACYTTGCIGAFHDVTAFWGVQFEIDGNLHYGWVQVETLGGIRTGGNVLDWAYNTIPGQPILAGQVPEPGTISLLVLGAVAIAWRHPAKEVPKEDRRSNGAALQGHSAKAGRR